VNQPTRGNTPSKPSGDRPRAAAYLRMSTELQQYSTENQRVLIQAFADSRNMDIVRVYADEGKSGLNLEGRESLKRLIRDVESRSVDFSFILVYDVSRWGRFQDPDEAASYELRCKQAGVRILYCAEQFENDGSPISSVIKSLKRSMAAEFVRELGEKVKRGQTRLVQHGVRQGGPAGYGLRRYLIDQAGQEKGELARGEHKSLQTQRVILKPGPPEEVETVKAIYSEFVHEGRTESEIAKWLNDSGKLTDRGVPWSRGTVHQILINEKYVGHNVWNRVSFRLKEKRVKNPPAEWVRKDHAFTPIVETLMFEAARQIILSRSYRMSDGEMLDALRSVLRRNGVLSGLIIDEEQGCPSSSAFRSRFGSLLRTYELIEYSPDRDYRFVEINRRIRALHPTIVEQAIAAMVAAGASVENDPVSGLLRINDEFAASLVLCRCRATAAGFNRWIVRFDTALRPDITVVARMEPDARSIKDYYLLPSIDVWEKRVRLEDHNDFGIEAYRYDDLEILVHLSRRVPLRGVSYG
jgi:DNA invertase Pin-like site-specific DNA recombinase